MWRTKACSFLMRFHQGSTSVAKAYREDWEGFLAFFGSPAKTVGGPGLLAALRIASKPPVNYR
jgi:hypothetical protein